MSIDETELALKKLFDSIELTQEDIDGVSVYDLPPSNLPPESKPKIKKVRSFVGIEKKYEDMSGFKTKEEKMTYVISRIMKAIGSENLTRLFSSGVVVIEYSRAYKSSIGGPVVLIGNPVHKSARDRSMGRERFGEINGKFPIYNMIAKLKQVVGE